MHALTMVLLQELRLALVLGPEGQHADADAQDDGNDGNEGANYSRIHSQFSKCALRTPLIPAGPGSGCSNALQPVIWLSSNKHVQAAIHMKPGLKDPIPSAA